MPGVGRKAHFWLHTHMFSQKKRVPKSTFFPRMLAGVGQTPHGNALSHRAANGDVTIYIFFSHVHIRIHTHIGMCIYISRSEA